MSSLRSSITLIFSLFIFIFLFSPPGVKHPSLGARTNEGTAVCLIDRGVVPPGWWLDDTVDCERYNR